jgi:phosphoribosylcarboxyaminoimidazole (NCAIR) mutase
VKLALLADVHANLPALDACLEHAREQGADAIVADAARILGASDAAIGDRVEAYARELEAQVEQKNERLKASLRGTE